MSIYRYSCARKAVPYSSKMKVHGNHCLISLLSIPSKIVESDINEILAIVGHILKDNNLASDMHRQWTCRSDHSTEYQRADTPDGDDRGEKRSIQESLWQRRYLL